MKEPKIVLLSGSRVIHVGVFAVWLPFPLVVLDAFGLLVWFVIRHHKTGFLSKLCLYTPWILPSLTVQQSCSSVAGVNRYVLYKLLCEGWQEQRGASWVEAKFWEFSELVFGLLWNSQWILCINHMNEWSISGLWCLLVLELLLI